MCRLLITLIVLLSNVLPSLAQLSLDDYRAQVVEYSISLKGAQNALQQSEESVSYAKTLLLPKLSANGSYQRYLKGFDGQEPWSLSLEPQIVQTIYGGGVVRAEVERSELNSRVAMCNEAFTLLEVDYAAKYAYWNYWAMNRLYLVMQQYVAIIELQGDKIEYRYREGYTSKGDLLMMRSQLSEAEYRLIAASKTRLDALYNLNMLRGAAPTDSVMIEGVELAEFAIPQREPIGVVVERRADYQAMLLKEQIAKATTKSVRGGYNPTLQGGVNGGLRSRLPNVNGDTYWDGAIVVSLSVPIYRFGERHKSVAISRSAERQASLNSVALLDEITNDESRAWSAVVESSSQTDLMRRSLDIASENLEISTYSYNEGLVSILELMQAQISWIQIYNNSINSQYNYLVALSYYNKIVGGK